LNVCKLKQILESGAFDRRFLTLKEMSTNVDDVFMSEKLVDDTTASTNISWLKAKGPCLKSDIKQRRNQES